VTYLDLINLFWDSATINPLSTGQVSLYFALLHVCNRSYWTEWFSVPNQVLSILTGLSRAGIQKARNELKQRGFIEFKEQGTKATCYKIVMENSVQKGVQDNCLIANSVQDGVQVSVQKGVQDNCLIANSVQDGAQVSVQKGVQDNCLIANSVQDGAQVSVQKGVQDNCLIANSVQDGVQVSVQKGVQDNCLIANSVQVSVQKGVQNGGTLKDIRQKIKDKEIPPISPIRRFDDFLNAYPNKQRRYLAEKAYCDLIVSGTVTEDALVFAAQNYAAHVAEAGGRMYLPNNFLENYVFEDYLPKMEEPSKNDPKKEPEEELVGDDWLDLEV